MSLAAHGVTHPGRRTTNEDAFLVDPGRGLFVVADGMGGHNAGEVASGLAVKTIREFLADGTPRQSERRWTKRCGWRTTTSWPRRARSPTTPAWGRRWRRCCVEDGEAVLRATSGDSRVYLLRDGRLTQLTRDDSWVRSAC